MGNPRPRPQLLAAKLWIIRRHLRLDHVGMKDLLGLRDSARVYEYENDKREPKLQTILAYSYAAQVPMATVCDDSVSTNEFRALLGTFDIRSQKRLEHFPANEESQQPQHEDQSKPLILISGHPLRHE